MDQQQETSMVFMRIRRVLKVLALSFLWMLSAVLDFLGDTSPWPKRYMRLRRPDGRIVEALVIEQIEDVYIVEIRLTEPAPLTFWKYEAETKVVNHDDISVVSIDPPFNWGSRIFGSFGH